MSYSAVEIYGALMREWNCAFEEKQLQAARSESRNE